VGAGGCVSEAGVREYRPAFFPRPMPALRHHAGAEIRAPKMGKDEIHWRSLPLRALRGAYRRKIQDQDAYAWAMGC